MPGGGIVPPLQTRTIIQGDLTPGDLHLSADGAGPCQKYRCKLLFKVGAGAVVVNWESEYSIKGIGLLFGEVPNPRLQTVPRAEVWAPIMGLQALDLNFGDVSKLDSDASYVVTNAAKLSNEDPRKGPLAGVHGELWHECQSLFREGSLTVPTKVTSHLALEEVGKSISLQEYILNGIADKLAGLAVEQLDYETRDGIEVEKNVTSAFLVCMRLAIIEKSRAEWAKFHKVRKRMPPQLFVPEVQEGIPLIHDKILTNGHKLEKIGRNVLCLKCQHKGPLAKVFLFENFDCLTDEVTPITCPEDFPLPGPVHEAEDLLCNLQPMLQKAALQKRNDKAASLKVIRAAALQYAENLPKVGTTLASATLFQPATASRATFHPSNNWLVNLHPSHRLWTAGGLAFCSECGAVSQGTSKGRLSLGCGTKLGKVTTRPRLIGQNPRASKMPAGSVWKTQQLLSGMLRGVGKTV